MIDPSQVPAPYVVPVRTDRSGEVGPTLDQARGPGWRRASRGLYVPAHVDATDVGQRIVEAAAVLRPGCAITGWAALRWLGAKWFDGTAADGSARPVTIALGTHDLRRQAGIAISAEGLGEQHRMTHRGLVLTLPTYAVSFEMRYARSLGAAVRVLDLACYDDVVSLAEMATFLANQNGWTGIPLARKAWVRAVENSWSPRESDMRETWLHHKRATLLCNRPLFDLRGRHLETPDLLDVRAGVVGEYDGRHHLERARRDIDVRREEHYRDLGLELVLMTAADVHDDRAFVDRLGRAYARAARRRRGSRRPRAWTVEPPEGWVLTDTVARRRALTPDQARRFLAYRRAA